MNDSDPYTNVMMARDAMRCLVNLLGAHDTLPEGVTGEGLAALLHHLDPALTQALEDLEGNPETPRVPATIQ